MKSQARIPAPILLISFALGLYAAQPWSKDASQWTPADAQRILNDSPWAQSAAASFAPVDADQPPPPGPLPGAAQAGMAGPHGATDGRWDGGVGKLPSGTMPTLPVAILWESALPVRQALQRVQPPAEPATRAQTDYILTVRGLVPAGRYRSAGQLQTQSRSDSSSSADSAADPQDPEPLLEGLMAQSRLMPRNGKPIAPEDVKLDAATGTLRFFFPRSQPIELKDKEVLFYTRFGSMTIRRQFRLKEMVYQRKLEL